MHPFKSSNENLKGFDAFTRVIARGKKYEIHPINAFVFLSIAKEPSLRIGYAVTKKIRIAAHRNRMKRLMREAFRSKKAEFIKQIKSDTLVEIVFMYNGRTEIAPRLVRFASINRAFSDLCLLIEMK
jgi:ribonuclease P protein component